MTREGRIGSASMYLLFFGYPTAARRCFWCSRLRKIEHVSDTSPINTACTARHLRRTFVTLLRVTRDCRDMHDSDQRKARLTTLHLLPCLSTGTLAEVASVCSQGHRFNAIVVNARAHSRAGCSKSSLPLRTACTSCSSDFESRASTQRRGASVQEAKTPYQSNVDTFCATIIPNKARHHS